VYLINVGKEDATSHEIWMDYNVILLTASLGTTFFFTSASFSFMATGRAATERVGRDKFGFIAVRYW
jgi:hypothetical protein